MHIKILKEYKRQKLKYIIKNIFLLKQLYVYRKFESLKK